MEDRGHSHSLCGFGAHRVGDPQHHTFPGRPLRLGTVNNFYGPFHILHLQRHLQRGPRLSSAQAAQRKTKNPDQHSCGRGQIIQISTNKRKKTKSLF